MYQSDFQQQHSGYFMNMNNNSYEQQQLKALPDTENMALHYFCSNSVSSDMNNTNLTILDNTISSLSTTMIQTTTSQSHSHTPKYHRISSIASIGSTISTSSPSINKRKSKKNRKSRKNNKKPNTTQSYDPISTHRAQGRIQISKAMTEKIIPILIKEQITDLYIYMDKSIGLCDENNFVTDRIKVLHFDFHDKKTNEILYCVAEKQDDNAKSSRGYQWKIIDKLFTENDIYNQYKIKNISLPKCIRNNNTFKNELKDGEKIKQFLLNNNEWQKLLTKAKWCKTDVLTKANNKRRITLSVTKTEFMKTCNENMKLTKHKIKLLPIVMFSSSECKYWIEHLWIIHMKKEQISIGISFKYDNERNNVIVRGIHLDKDYILRQHQLALPQHKCNCLHNFQSYINDFRIGNPDDNLNRIKYYKQQIEELQKKLQIFEDKSNDNNIMCEDKSEVLNIETTCLIQQESDNCYCNNNQFVLDELNIAEYNIPQTPTFDD